MSFTSDWDNAEPIDHTKFKNLPGEVRDVRIDLEDRLNEILSGFVSGETIQGIKLGKFITIGTAAGSTPTGTGDAVTIDVYGRANGTATAVELWSLDASGNECQITDGGSLKSTASADFKTGDWILSTVTTARTGWTNVSATYANKFIRISTAGLSTGGTDAHTHTGPAHTHTTDVPKSGWSYGAGAYGTMVTVSGEAWYAQTDQTITSSSSGTGNTGSGANVPAYITVVIFQKD